MDELIASLKLKEIDIGAFTYETDKKVTSGKWGVVNLAKIEGTPERFAVKLIQLDGIPPTREALVEKMLLELKTSFSFEHPNIVTPIGYSVSDDWYFFHIVSPWAENGNVLEYISLTKVDMNTRIALSIDTIFGLKFLHDNKLVHGDMKPQNILVNSSGRAMISDFGLSRAIVSRYAMTGKSTLGDNQRDWFTYNRSPEICEQDDSPKTYSSDIWAWGCVIYTMLTDKVPYNGISGAQASLLQTTSDTLPDDPDNIGLPVYLRMVIKRCWSKSADDRASASECLNRLLIAEGMVGYGVLKTKAEDLVSEESTLLQWSSIDRDNLHSTYHRIRALHQLEKVYQIRAMYNESRRALGEARLIHHQLGNIAGLHYCQLAIGNSTIMTGKYGEAQKILHDTYLKFQQMGETYGSTSCRWLLGQINLRRSEYDEARHAFTTTFNEYSRLGDTFSAILGTKALGECDSLERKDAKPKMTEALNEYEKYGDAFGIAYCKLTIAEALLADDPPKISEAKDGIEECLVLFTDVADDPLGVLQCQKALAEVYRHENKQEEAREILVLIRDQYRKFRDPNGFAWTKWSIAYLDKLNNKHRKARDEFNEVLEIFKALGVPLGVAYSHWALGTIYGSLKEFDTAMEHTEDAKAIFETIGAKDFVDICDALVDRIKTVQKEIDGENGESASESGSFKNLFIKKK